MKYWNSRRIRKTEEREKWREDQAVALYKQAEEVRRRYTKGDLDKNAWLILDALGLPARRALLLRLKKNGAMSLSKLGKPLAAKLPWLHKQMLILERCHLITTHKRGRVRMCVYNPAGFAELAAWLVSRR